MSPEIMLEMQSLGRHPELLKRNQQDPQVHASFTHSSSDTKQLLVIKAEDAPWSRVGPILHIAGGQRAGSLEFLFTKSKY